MSRPERTAVVLLVLLASIGCDQGTKRLAQTQLRGSPGYSYLADTVRLQYAENPGAFLSLGARLSPAWREAIFSWGVGMMLAGLAAFVVFKRRLDGREVFACALLLGGGLSNWGDRVGRGGSVVDFLNLGVGPLRTGIFNVADLAVVAGVALLAFPSLLKDRRAGTA